MDDDKLEQAAFPVAAVIVTFNPDPSIKERVRLVIDQVDEVVIVDNSTRRSVRFFVQKMVFKRNVTILENGENIGIASALNRGIQYLRVKGYRWVLTLDHDSIPSEGMLSEQMRLIDLVPNSHRIAIVAPNIIEEAVESHGTRWLTANPRWPFLFKRIECDRERMIEVDVVITSGALINMEVYSSIGPLRDDFFIDYVDTEFCLRAKNAGYKILVACDSILRHRLGERTEKTILGIRFIPTNHSPIRHYYISRNRVVMYKIYAIRFPYWCMFDLVAMLYNWIRIFIGEDARTTKGKMFLRGLIDGVKGRMGSYEVLHRK